jgi:hypothetical protein
MSGDFKEIEQYPDTWKIGRSTLDGKPVFIRYRSGIVDAIGHPNYPFQIGIAVPLLNPTTEGLTTEEEAEVLSGVEDSLNLTLGENSEAVEVMVITTNGMREFVFYASEWKPEYFEKKVKNVDGKSHQLQFIMQRDPKWETFSSLLPRQS